MMSPTNRFLFLVFFVAWILPVSAFAGGDLYVESRGEQLYLGDQSIHAVSERDAAELTKVGIGWAFDGKPLEGFRIYYFSSGDNYIDSLRRFDGAIELTRDFRDHLIAIDYGYELLDFMRPYLRWSNGLAYQHLEAESDTGQFQQSTYDYVTQGSGGLELFYTFSEGGDGLPGFRMGFVSEVGYRWQTKATFDQLESDAKNEAPVEMGRLNTNGVFWNMGLSFGLLF